MAFVALPFVCSAAGASTIAVGLHHFAWNAGSREDVDRLHDRLLAAGVTILDAPAAYPQYGAGYYAVFFADPDGLKLEYVHYTGASL